MPRFFIEGNTEEMQELNIPGAGNFKFSAVRLEDLIEGAAEYTLATVIMDISGSVSGYKAELEKVAKQIVLACKHSPRAENLMLRFLLFNYTLHEVHGFKLLKMLDLNTYQIPEPEGLTALYDATYSGVGATLTFSKSLIAQDFSCNGCIYIVTDGENNNSTATPDMIKQLINQARQEETIQGLITVLIGITPDSRISTWLKKFKEEANLTAYIHLPNATPNTLAKLSNFISKSISSQSQSLAGQSVTQTYTI